MGWRGRMREKDVYIGGESEEWMVMESVRELGRRRMEPGGTMRGQSGVDRRMIMGVRLSLEL
jgi:hypothetical protein